VEVKLLDYTDDAEFKIGLYAAECYDSKTDRESCLRRTKSCKDSGHLATLRFAYATFRVSGISRVCSHQLVRHAHLSYLQRSQRYVAEKEVNFIDPSALEQLDFDTRIKWGYVQDQAERLYLDLVNSKKMKKEDARFILPQGCDTSVTITGNLQAWLDFVNLRTEKHAQWEIREVALAIQDALRINVAPSIFA
jgi:thymidylate synthase (FAD)